MIFDWDRWLFEIRLHPEFYDSTYELAEQIHRCMTETGEGLFEYEHGQVHFADVAYVYAYPLYESTPDEPIVLRSGIKPLPNLKWREYEADTIIGCLCDLVEFGYLEEVLSDSSTEKLEVPTLSETGVGSASFDYDVWHTVARPSIPAIARDGMGRPVFPQAS